MARCVDCCNLDLCDKKESYINEYWCDKDYVEGWKNPNQTACDSFTEAYGRTDAEKERAIKGISDGCFIVTMVCNLLGKEPEHDSYLKTFKNFKRNYLMKQIELYDFLYLYESLGPAIAHKMKKQGENASRMAKNLYYIYFPEIIKDINEEHNIEAFRKYVDLVKVLAKACNFTIERRNEQETSKTEENKKAYTIGYNPIGSYSSRPSVALR